MQAGSGATTLGVPTSPGVTDTVVADTLLAAFNDLDQVRALFRAHPGDIAAVFVEPVAGNMGLIPPDPGFLEGLRAITESEGALLVMDEVMTGFRLARGGAQELYGVHGDLVTLGKIIGGGLPVGAYGGSAKIMEMLAPAGPVYQAGTLSGNPLAVAAGMATLSRLDAAAYDAARGALAQRMEDGVRAVIRERSYPLTYVRVGSMSCLYFRTGDVRNYDDAKGSDTAAFARYFHGMLRRGIYLAPSQFEAGFISLAHTEADIDRTLEAGREALAEAFGG